MMMDVFQDIEVETTADVPADRLWNIIGAGSGVDRWFGAITSCRVDGEARYCTMIDGSDLVETILGVEPKTMTFRYSVDTHPLPAGRIVSYMSVRAIGSHKSRIVWASRIEAETKSAAQATADALRELYGQGLASLIATAKADVIEASFAAGAAARDIDWDRPSVDDLAPIDNFHIGGVELVDGFFDRLGIKPGTAALDLGAGLGGPARRFAQRFGGTVTAIDCNPVMTRLAKTLSRKVAMDGSVVHVDGDAADMPIGTASVDLAYSIHVYIFLSDPAHMFAEVARVLKPGGTFGLFSPVTIDRERCAFPQPWAASKDADGSLSHARLLDQISQAGLAVEVDHDASSDALSWFGRSGPAISPADRNAPPYGIGIVAGPAFPDMVGNVRANLAKGVLGLRMIRAVRRAG